MLLLFSVNFVASVVDLFFPAHEENELWDGPKGQGIVAGGGHYTWVRR
jgi:hypothetical protein